MVGDKKRTCGGPSTSTTLYCGQCSAPHKFNVIGIVVACAVVRLQYRTCLSFVSIFCLDFIFFVSIFCRSLSEFVGVCRSLSEFVVVCRSLSEFVGVCRKCRNSDKIRQNFVGVMSRLKKMDFFRFFVFCLKMSNLRQFTECSWDPR